MRRNARHRRGNNTGYSAALHSLTLQSVCFTSYASHAIVSPIPVKVLFLKILIFADTRDVFQIVWSKTWPEVNVNEMYFDDYSDPIEV